MNDAMQDQQRTTRGVTREQVAADQARIERERQERDQEQVERIRQRMGETPAARTPFATLNWNG